MTIQSWAISILIIFSGIIANGQNISVAGIGTTPYTSTSGSLICDTIFSFPAIDTWPGGITTDGSTLYSIGYYNHFIYKHSMNGVLLDSIPNPFNAPTNLVGGDLDFDGTHLLVFAEHSDTLYKLDPVTGTVVFKYHVAPCNLDCYGVAYDGTGIWISDYATDLIYKTDPNTGAVLKTLTLPNSSLILSIKFINGDLYGLGIFPSEVYKIDTANGAILGVQPWCLGYSTGFFEFNNNIYACSSLLSAGGTQRIYTFEASPLDDQIDLKASTEFAIYPNPSGGKFKLAFPATLHKGNISVINMLGEIIYENDFNTISEIEIILPSITHGMHIVKVTDSGYTRSQKIIIESE